MITLPIRSAWLFPGQGSQEVGMGAKLFKKYERAKNYLEMAEEYSGQKIGDIMRRGPEAELAKTEIVQPAVVAVSCAFVDLMKEAGEAPDIVAGHSLGEYSALYAAGVLSAECVVRLACDRGRLMGQGAQGAMVAVKSLAIEVLLEIIDDIHSGHICLANHNAPSQLVVSGEEVPLAELCERVREHGGDFVRLNVSGAWHSPLVAVAAHEFEKCLARAQFQDPTCAIMMASSATVAKNAIEIRTTMMKQMTNPVRWFDVVQYLHAAGCQSYHEVGPGKVLKGLMRRIIADESSYTIQGVDTSQTIDRLTLNREINHGSKASSK